MHGGNANRTPEISTGHHLQSPAGSRLTGLFRFGGQSLASLPLLPLGTEPPLFNHDRNPKVKVCAMSENNQTNSNGRGGARKGAGRKPGAATSKTREIADKAAEGGITPLEYMLTVMRDDSTHEDDRIQAQREAMRFEAAKAAAPYIHPRLATVEHTGANGGPVETVSRIELVALSDSGTDRASS